MLDWPGKFFKYKNMVHDKIALTLKDIAKLKEKLKDVKKDMKQQEKLDTTEYLDLKKALKELKAQVKDLEEVHEEELKSDDWYNQLREMKVKSEEELALANEKLFALIDELPQKFFEMDVEVEDGKVKIQVQPQMQLFVNGKEEKRRA